jgi:uncharacterized membrane protein
MPGMYHTAANAAAPSSWRKAPTRRREAGGLDGCPSASHMTPWQSWEGQAMAMPQTPAAGSDTDTRLMAIIVYGLYLVGWPCLHMPTIAGLVLAYIKRSDAAGTIWESHFQNQIETFWISLAVGAIAIPLCFVGIGFVILPLLVIWFLYRTIKGLVRAIEHQPYV